jgi:hypothetical protein
MADSKDRRLDAYLAGDLSASEQRTLAQQALDDPELFDELTSAAMIKAAAADEPIVPVRRTNSSRMTWLLAGAAAAAVIAIVAVYRSSSSPAAPAPATTASTPSTPNTEPAATTPTAAQPVILAARLDELAARPAAEFRAPADTSRSPKNAGVVVALEDGEAAIDIGSLDGVTKGSELSIFRGAGRSRPIGRLTVTTVFRERARGRAASGSVQVGDRIDVPAALQLSALLEQVLARLAAGDSKTAGSLATQAVAMSTNASDADSAEAMNELAAVLIRERDYQAAETLLRRAQTGAAAATAVRVTNNLAALAAMRGDVTTAESLYRSALALADSSPEYESARRAIESNLQDLRAPR